jgi:hypothetical protein
MAAHGTASSAWVMEPTTVSTMMVSRAHFLSIQGRVSAQAFMPPLEVSTAVVALMTAGTGNANAFAA